jgi:hypothetical protein
VQPVQPFVPPPQVQQPPPRPPFPFPAWLYAVIFLPLIIAQQRRAEQQARETRRQREEEEESKTPYDQREPMENWEYKIVRNDMNLFEQPALLEQALREESQAGWQLVEKFDGNRLRLKRDANIKSAAALANGYDPYRTMVLLEHVQALKEQRRRKNLKIAAVILSVGMLLLLVGIPTGTTAASNSPLELIGFVAAFIGGTAALIGGIVAIVHYFSK